MKRILGLLVLLVGVVTVGTAVGADTAENSYGVEAYKLGMTLH